MNWKSALTQVKSVKLLELFAVYRQEGHTIHALLHVVNSLREGNVGIGGFLFPFSLVISVFSGCGSLVEQVWF